MIEQHKIQIHSPASTTTRLPIPSSQPSVTSRPNTTQTPPSFLAGNSIAGPRPHRLLLHLHSHCQTFLSFHLYDTYDNRPRLHRFQRQPTSRLLLMQTTPSSPTSEFCQTHFHYPPVNSFSTLLGLHSQDTARKSSSRHLVQISPAFIYVLQEFEPLPCSSSSSSSSRSLLLRLYSAAMPPPGRQALFVFTSNKLGILLDLFYFSPYYNTTLSSEGSFLASSSPGPHPSLIHCDPLRQRPWVTVSGGVCPTSPCSCPLSDNTTINLAYIH